MKSTPTAAMDVLLNLTPLDLLIMAEVRMALYRLQILKQAGATGIEAWLLSIRKSVSDPILEMRLDHTIPVYYHCRLFKVIIDLDYWKNKNPACSANALIWYTDGSRVDKGTGSGIFGLRTKGSFSFSLGKFATSFQTEIYATLQCACENLRGAYRNKRILIFSDSQTALSGLKVASELVVGCLNALFALAGLNEVTRLGAGALRPLWQ
jgi:hypothetical protein